MLITLGARNITVISRSGKPPNEKAQQIFDKWKAAGVNIEGHASDMADYSRLQVK
jgi:hypothetical protein